MAQKTEELFGFSIEPSKKDKAIDSPVPSQLDDGTELPVGARVGYLYEGDQKARTEINLIAQYRDVALYPEADNAIDDIVNEAFTTTFERPSVSIRLDLLQINDKIKKIIREEFKTALHLLKFQKKSYDIFRQWYVDGRLYYQVIVDEKNPREGIKELRPMDALKTKRNVIPEYKKDERTQVPILTKINEYFEYMPDKNERHGVKLSKDSVVFCPSGIVDRNRSMIIGYLDKAIKPFNNLRAMEDALIVYRIARAPERRIFYVDVGQMPKIKAEQYLRDMMNRYRNKIDYNPNTGEIRDGRKFMSMLEDFWLPRRDGSTGTQIDTLPGGTNLSDLDDVQYFKDKLYQSLNVPISRMNQGEAYQLGRSTDIGRDEVKFSKFVKRLRRQFSELFNEILRIQLVLKGVCTSKEFEEMRQYISYDFLQDTYFEELKAVEVLNDQLNALAAAQPFVGQYFSVQYLRKMVLGQTEEDIARMDMEIMEELNAGIIKSQAEMQGLPPEGQEEETVVESVIVEGYDLSEYTDEPEINTSDDVYETLMEQIRNDLR
jgi:hypothetical protein